MTITITNLKRPGVTYDSTKLNSLVAIVDEGVRKRTNNEQFVKGRVQGNTLKINVYHFNPKTRKGYPTRLDEQDKIAANISNFLTSQGITANVTTK